jgi:2-polyprenyl-3-methyl-5-hydroxy-6-metoxy-1,4-benzoquinol methylase
MRQRGSNAGLPRFDAWYPQATKQDVSVSQSPLPQDEEFQRGAWYDRWLVSDALEELEANGLEGQGRQIIQEFNRLYERTGTLRRVAEILAPELRRIHSQTGRPVRVLDMSTRDGTLLHLLADLCMRDGVPLDLHGVEFREDIVDYARECCEARGDSITIHYDPTRVLGAVGSGSYDIVCSTFMMHHRTPALCAQILTGSHRVARFGVHHFDVRRGVLPVMLSWAFSTLFRFTITRRDSVLTFRRAFRPHEMRSLIQRTRVPLRVRSLGPMYMMIESSDLLPV